MFRALKDILHEGKHERYYETTGAGMQETTPAATFTTTTTAVPLPAYREPGVAFVPVESGHTGVRERGIPIVELERREVKPIIHEVIHPTERVEIQPFVHRNREQVEVREITQPIIERGTAPVIVHEAVLPEVRKEMPPVNREVIEEQLRKSKEGLTSSKRCEVPIRTVEEKPPIIEETIKKKVYEEIVPIVDRHINEPHLIRERKPIYEKIYEGPTFVRQELPCIERQVGITYDTGCYTSAAGSRPKYAREGYSGGEGYQQESVGTRGQQYAPPGLTEVPIATGYIPRTELPPGQVRYT